MFVVYLNLLSWACSFRLELYDSDVFAIWKQYIFFSISPLLNLIIPTFFFNFPLSLSVFEAKDGTISVASAFAGHQEGNSIGMFNLIISTFSRFWVSKDVIETFCSVLATGSWYEMFNTYIFPCTTTFCQMILNLQALSIFLC